MFWEGRWQQEGLGMQWKAANKHVEKYWCLLTEEVCREPALAAPLPSGTGRRRLWQHRDSWATVGTSPALLLRHLK